MFFLALIILFAFLAWHYRRYGIHTPRLIYQPSTFNQEIAAQLSRLSRPYKPTPWAYNAHAQLVWLVLSGTFKKSTLNVQRELLTMADGATTALDWFGDTPAPGAPIVVVLHTIGGSRQSMSHLITDLHAATGWTTVLCLRRGHDTLPLTAAGYNTMGNVEDLREQLAHIKARYPDSPLYGIGSSAGSGLIVRYLGEEKENSLLAAGIAYCPAYDIEVAFERAHPFYSRKITRDLIREFIAPQAQHLDQHIIDNAHHAKDLVELQASMHHFAGYSDERDYLKYCNPAPVMTDIHVPLLVINADDDPVCVVQNVEEHQDTVFNMEKTLLVRTRRGSHCAFYEGWRARSWSNAVMADYLKAIDASLTTKPEQM